jgi:hypothetical protein
MRRFKLTIGIVIGVLVVAGIVVGILYATGVLGKKGGGPSLFGPGGTQKFPLGPGGTNQYPVTPLGPGGTRQPIFSIQHQDAGIYVERGQPYSRLTIQVLANGVDLNSIKNAVWNATYKLVCPSGAPSTFTSSLPLTPLQPFFQDLHDLPCANASSLILETGYISYTDQLGNNLQTESLSNIHFTR